MGPSDDFRMVMPANFGYSKIGGLGLFESKLT